MQSCGQSIVGLGPSFILSQNVSTSKRRICSDINMSIQRSTLFNLKQYLIVQNNLTEYRYHSGTQNSINPQTIKQVQTYIFMKKSFLLAVLVALLALHAYSQTFDAVFAFSWFAGHCAKVGGCDPNIVKLWDHQSFTIHGLWVTRPPNTSKPDYGAFDVNLVKANSTLYDQMMNYWPPKSRTSDSTYFLWDHEWDNHGHDYAKAVYTLYKDTKYKGLTGVKLNQKLQTDFFIDTIQFYLKYPGVQKFPMGSNIVMETFTGILKIGSNHSTFSCSSKGNIREAKVCFEIRSSGTFTKPCADQTFVGCSTTIPTYTLAEWAKSTQKRVFNLPPARSAQASQESEEDAVKEKEEETDEDSNERAEGGREDENREGGSNSESGEGDKSKDL